MADWLPAAMAKTAARIVVEDAPAQPNDRFTPNVSEKRLYERLPDVVLVSSGAGPVPDHWAKGQTTEFTITVFSDAVQYSANWVDTMFIRGHTCRILSFNGLLRAHFEATLLGGLHARLADDAPPRTPMPKRRLWDTQASHKRKLQAWLNGPKPQRRDPVKEALDGHSPMPNLRRQLAERVGDVMRNSPEIAKAQACVWGAPDPDPTVWFHA